jgi:phage virion morphogenesis protein
MAGAHFSVDVLAGDADAQLQRLDDSLGNTAPLVAQIGEYLQSATESRFRTQTGPEGTAWQPLTPRYLRRKKRNKDKILTLDGYLRRFIRWQADGTDAVLVGTDRKYGAIHQFGGSINMPARQATVHFGAGKAKNLFVKKKKAATSRQVTVGAHKVTMPARPYLGLAEADTVEVTQITLDWLKAR